MYRHDCEDCDLIERVANSIFSEEEYLKLIEIAKEGLEFLKLKQIKEVIKK